MNNKPWQFETVNTLLKKNSDECGNSVAFYLSGHDRLAVTYEDLFYSVVNLQDFIMSKFKNSHIGILGENSSEWFLAFLSILSSGCIAVPIEYELSISDVLKRLKFADCKAVFLSEDYFDYKDYLEDNGIQVISLSYINAEVKAVIKKERPLNKSLKMTVQPDSPGTIVFTSGTSGDSKGVVLTHKGLISSAYCSMNIFSENHVYTGMTPLPLYHIFALSDAIAAILIGRLTGYVTSIRNMVNDIIQYKPNFILAVPIMVEKAYEKIKYIPRFIIKSFLGKHFIGVLCGGAALPAKLQKKMFKKGIPIIQGYGMTECSPIIAVDDLNKGLHFGSVGKAIDCCTVSVSEPDEYGIGELVVSGDNVMLGYYKNPEATAQIIKDGVLYTGDLGYIDKDGYIYITGRKKNLIILSNGKNVSPEELEGKFLNYHYINEVSVYEKDGEIVGEFYLNKQKYSNAENLLKKDVLSVNKTLPKYKNIVKTIIRDIPFEHNSVIKASKRTH